MDNNENTICYSPVVVFTFKRLDLLERLIDSLESNAECPQTDLYFFSDRNVKKEDEEKVIAVREFLEIYKNKNHRFKSITVIAADSHKGLAKSVIEGVAEIIDRYGRVIVLEDDLIVSSQFLNYMNRCLQFYEDDDRIWAISGYSPNIRAKEKYDKAVYLDYRATSWGWATWKSRWGLVDWSVPVYSCFKWDLIGNMRLCRGGNDLPSMMRAQMKGKIDSWAVRWCFYESIYDKRSVAPTRSLVANDGFGDDATNCNEEGGDKFGRVALETAESDWCIANLEIDERICKELYKLYSIGITIRIRDKVREIKKAIKSKRL